MKEKDLLKALRKEVTNCMPNVYDKVSTFAVTPEKNKQINIEHKQPKANIKTRFVVAVALTMVLVFAVAVAMPFIINARTGSGSSIQQTTEDNIESV